ncbi:hypothetical protein [Streptomyces sp. NPDC002328]|uniref:hypothetical protein n=1 Tax=Streptomyces sp. NPDC002328 TaxID=3364642 RepID=UPI0036BF536A
MLNTSRQVGGAPAVAVSGALVAQHSAFFHGLRTSLLTATALLLLTTSASLLVRPPRSSDHSRRRTTVPVGRGSEPGQAERSKGGRSVLVHRAGRAADRDGSLKRVLARSLVVATTAVQIALGTTAGTAAHASEPGGPDYGVVLKETYLATDVGGTLTVLPEVYTLRSDGSRAYVPQGKPVGPGTGIEYALPWSTSPVDLDERAGCRTVEDKGDSRQHVRCDRVAPVTFRVDKAFVGYRGEVRFFPQVTPDDGRRWQDDMSSFVVTAPAPQEEGETKESRARREAVGVKLLALAGGFGLLALLLALRLKPSRTRRTAWIAAGTAAAVCAGPGVWSIAEGPLVGAKTYTRYPSGRPVLQIPHGMWDNAVFLEKTRPDYVPPIATAPDPGHEDVTEVSGVYLPAPPQDPKNWVTVNGAYGRIDDPRRARDHMLRTAAEAPGVKVLQAPRLILLKEDSATRALVLCKCQALSVRGRPVSMCAWADEGVRALVTVPGTQLPASSTVSVRDYVQLGTGF